MKKEKLDLIYKALFHNGGRLVSRLQGRSDERLAAGKDWLQGLPQLTLEENSRADKIIALADRIASGVPEQRKVSSDQLFKPLADIFNVFKEEKQQRYQKFSILPDESKLSIASREESPINQLDYQRLLEELAESFNGLTLDEANLSVFFNIWQNFFSTLPLLPGDKELGDISLAELSRLTAGFAAAIYDYLEESQQDHLLDDVSTFYESKSLLLSSFDLSGIQDFIYNIASKGAAKQLKARSLYLDFMSEHIVDSLLEQLELSRANALYVGGGHAYFILANTEQTIGQLKEFEKAFNQFFLEHFQTGLYVAFGWKVFSAAEIMVDTYSGSDYLKNYREIYQGISRMISEKKLSRYDTASLRVLNQGGRSSERECAICHSVEKIKTVHYGEDEEYDLCIVCQELSRFAKEIDSDYFQVASDGQSGLPIGPGAVLKAVKKEDIGKDPGKLYVKNKWSDDTVATPVFVGNYNFIKDDGTKAEIYDYAGLSRDSQTKQGIKRLAVVRLDVDDLGAAFMAGFTSQKHGRFSTFARSAIFSQKMSLFFKYYIHQFAQGKRLTVIYAGGDDVFALGSWQDIIAFTVEFRQQFLRWTNGKLTLSAGIGLYPDKTPIHLMAQDSGDLEEAAKSNGKDSITLFERNFTFKFDQFIEGVYQSKLVQLRKYFKSQDERGKAFIYRLIELLRAYDKLNTARLAYLLARLEDAASKEEKEKFKEFKNIFWAWYTGGEQERQEAEMALLLYIYEIRKD